MPVITICSGVGTDTARGTGSSDAIGASSSDEMLTKSITSEYGPEPSQQAEFMPAGCSPAAVLAFIAQFGDLSIDFKQIP